MEERPNTVVKEGVIYIDDDPLYIVEYIDDLVYSTNYITVYAVADVSKGPEATKKMKQFPIKDFEVSTRTYNPPNFTPLSREDFKGVKPKRIRHKRDKPPLYLAPVEYGKDTSTGVEGFGFYEQATSNFTSQGGRVLLEKGSRTGVFVGLDRIHWKRTYVPTDDALKKHQVNRAIWGV